MADIEWMQRFDIEGCAEAVAAVVAPVVQLVATGTGGVQDADRLHSYSRRVAAVVLACAGACACAHLQVARLPSDSSPHMTAHPTLVVAALVDMDAGRGRVQTY